MSVQPSWPAPAPDLINEQPQHAAAIEALLNRAFGPGRFAKVSERVREFSTFAQELSFCAIEAGEVVGVVRMWRCFAGAQPIVFLGPLAVEAGARRSGLGLQLVQAACDAVRAQGEAAVVLVGDLPFFGRAGFAVAEHITLPGPVDPRRVLALTLKPVDLIGAVQSRPSA